MLSKSFKRIRKLFKRHSSEDCQIIMAKDHGLSVQQFDHHAVMICEKLQKAGFKAYIVGGGVRDLLLDRAPKDFDVSTSATPEEVKSLFSNCRLIGRRFRLAHVYFRRHIIEVATFRGESKLFSRTKVRANDHGLLVRDNVYGTLAEDAWRRDFRINALYYDPQHNQILDYVDGISDIENRALHVIGDPDIRFREDPVRILRAIRFAVKLDCSLDEDTQTKMREHMPLLSHISNARLFEEYKKLLLQGNAMDMFKRIRHFDGLDYLFPGLTAALNDKSHRTLVNLSLKNTDERIAIGKGINPGFLVAVFLWPLYRAGLKALGKGRITLPKKHEVAEQVVKAQAKTLSLPRVFAQTVKDMWTLQETLIYAKKARMPKLSTHPKFRAAFDFLALRTSVKEIEPTALRKWEKFIADQA